MVERIKRKINEVFLFPIGGFFRRFKKRPYPKGEKILIHLGCGVFDNKAFINVDARRGWHIHEVGKVEDVSKMFPVSYADLIYASHVIEHISHLDLPKVLKDLHSTLKENGILRISVPDFGKIIKLCIEYNNLRDLISILMGGQSYPDNFHYNQFTKKRLIQLLYDAGFKTVRGWDADEVEFHTFNDYSVQVNEYPYMGKKYNLNLNLEAIK